jgi:hypothetical protein
MELNDDDVLDLAKTNARFGGSPTCRVRQFMLYVQAKFKSPNTGMLDPNFSYLDQDGSGVPCRAMLVQGGGWQNGRLKFRLEFIPDSETETADQTDKSVLDDLRDKLDDVTH